MPTEEETTVAIIICVLVAFFFIAYLMLRQKKNTSNHNKDLAILYDQLMREIRAPTPTLQQPLDQNVNDLPYRKEYEVKRQMLVLKTKVGVGNFGEVWSGTLKIARKKGNGVQVVEKLPVAIKRPLDSNEPIHHKVLSDELKILCAIGTHPNVLALVGASTKNIITGEFYVIVEFCEKGNLKKFLEDRKGSFIDELRPVEILEGYVLPMGFPGTRYAAELDQQWSEEAEHSRLLPNSTTLTTSDLISFAMQIAQGMEYLSSFPCIHRDLAARNVLITSNFVCRVADFGLAKQMNKDYYRVKTNTVLPIRWMSIEAIEQGLFTVESDVWAYGILLYEIFTLGGKPYHTLPDICPLSLSGKMKRGFRNGKPNRCPREIYTLMQQCWQEQTTRRPTFSQCADFLRSQLVRSSPQLLNRIQKNIVEDAAKQENLKNCVAENLNQNDKGSMAITIN